jgi:outer membrane protein assembly factor BamB
VRRTIEGLRQPLSIQGLPGDRVLIAEFTTGRVAERDFTGKIVWDKAVPQALTAQRLPDGHTFIATRSRLMEVDRDGAEVWSAQRDETASAVRRRDGRIVVVSVSSPTVGSRCALLDSRGKELKSFPVGRCLMFAEIDALPNGRILIPEFYDNRVSEYDADGQRVWSVPVEQPASAVRLPNGHTLCASNKARVVVELDRTGRVVWEYKPPEEGTMPWRARRW